MIQNPPNTSENPVSNNFQIDPIGLLRRKFWVICFFVVVCVALAVLFYYKAPKTFESNARIYVNQQSAATLNTEVESLPESNVQKYLEILNSFSILGEAINNTDVEKMESLKEADDVLFTVRENLKVASADNKAASEVIKIRYQCGVEEDCEVMLTNILSSFDEFVRSDNRDSGGDKRESIEKIKTRQLEREKEIQAEIEELSSKPYVQIVDQKVYNQHDGQVSKLQIELDENASERLGFTALLEKLNDAKSSGTNIEDMIVETLQSMNEAQLGGYVATQQKYLELKVTEREMMGDYGDDHPTLKNLRGQLDVVDQLRKEQLLSAIRTNTSVQSSGDFLETVRSHVKNKIELSESLEAQLKEAISQAKAKSLLIAKDCDRLSKLLRERQQIDENRFALDGQMKEYDALSDFQWQGMRIIDPPSTAEQVAPDLLICLAAGLMLGCMLGVAFSILKELAEKTFRSSDEVAKQLGVPVVSQIGVFNGRIPRDSNFKKVKGDVISLHRPQSLPAESYKALRTSVFFNSQTKDSKIIQVTSPSPGDGKSTVSSNLAVVMAQAGRKVLIIDCDFRKPSQHVRFGLKNKVGMTSVIIGEATVEEAVQVIGLPNLHLISSGPQYANPAELLTTDRFPSLLDSIRDQYDFIILDTPPVLPVTDPVIISGYVDAVYMPIRIRNGVQVNAQRAIEALRTVGANVEGIVINGLRKKDAAGYNYGGYGYGGRSYGSYGSYKAAPTPINNGSGKSELSEAASRS